MENDATGFPNLITIPMINGMLNEWECEFVGYSGSVCACPIATLLKKRYGNDVSVCYTEVSFLAQGGTRSPIVRLDGPLSVVIMDIDSHFEGAEVPTAWLKSRLAIEVER